MEINNNEKIFYILINNTKEGPLSLDDLKNIKPSGDTLIWYYGISDWKKISDVEELKLKLKLYIQPPKLNNGDITIVTENLIEEKLTKISTENSTEFKKQKTKVFSKNEIQYFILWVAFHSFALLLSYGKVKGFNEKGWHKSEVIWPFSSNWTWCSYEGGTLILYEGTCESNGGVTTFNGFFSHYDITDFLLYIGISFFIMFFIYFSRKK